MRVLMIGPGKGVIGGITTLVEVLVPVLEQRVKLSYLSTVDRRPIKESGHFSMKNIRLAFSQYARFIAALFHSHPQIIHIHTSQGLAWLKDTFYILVGKVYGAKIILHVHAADFDDLYNKKSRPVQSYTRWAMGLTDAVISVSDEWKQRLTRIVPEGKTTSFPNCIAIDSFSPQSAHCLSNGVKALYVGSVGTRKGAFDLLEALGRLKSRNCVLQTCIAGYEDSKGDLFKAKSRLQELQLTDSCELPGAVQGQMKTELFERANLFVLPSYNEGLPMAILEGMSAGMAIVSTPVGGIPEVVRDGYNGFLVPPGDIDALSEKLAVLAHDPQLCHLMGQRSREIVKSELDVKSYVTRLIDLYNSKLHS